jgi:hypothetical protein
MGAALETLASRAGVQAAAVEPASGSTEPPLVLPRRLPSGADRRMHPRRDSGCVVALYCWPNDRPVRPQEMAWRLHSAMLTGLLLDISLGGAGFLIPDEVAAGTTVLIRLTNRVLGDQFDTTATIVRSAPAEAGTWRTVCRFTQPLALEQVQRFGRHVFSSSVV